MASTGVDHGHSSPTSEYITSSQNKEYNDYEKNKHEEEKIQSRDSVSGSIKVSYDSTHRQLRPRHIQLIGIGGTIGTALYVQIGRGLMNGGPASLFLAFTIWCTFILAVTNVSDFHKAPIPKQQKAQRLTSNLVHERDGHIPPDLISIHSICWSLC